jgi:hypothetical protein
VAGRLDHGLYSGVFLSGRTGFVQLLAHRLRHWPLASSSSGGDLQRHGFFLSMAFSAS